MMMMNQVCTISCAAPPKCHCAQVYHLCQSALRGDGLPCSVTEVGAYVGQTYGVSGVNASSRLVGRAL